MKLQKTIVLGTNSLFEFGIKPMFMRGEITPAQYCECLDRLLKQSSTVRSDKVIIQEVIE